MMRPLLLVLLLLTATALAGCTNDDVGVDDALTESESGDAGTTPDTSTGPPLLDLEDPWGDALAMDLGSFTGGPGGIFQCSAVGGESLGSCLFITGGEFTGIPLGTQTLLLTLTGPDGEYYANVALPGSEYEFTETQSGMEVTWAIGVEPKHWEFTESSALAATIWRDGNGAVDSEDRTLQVTAIKDPEWVFEPIIDPWQDHQNRSIVDDGVIRIYEDNLSWQSSGELIFDVWTEELDLQEPIPLLTSHLIVGMVWQPVDCAPQDECAMTAQLRREGVITGISDDNTIAAEADTHRIVAWVSPEHFGPDRFDAATTAYDVRLFFSDCGTISTVFDAAFIALGTDESCNATEGVVQADVGVHVLIEAWRDDFDLDAFKQRLGVA